MIGMRSLLLATGVLVATLALGCAQAGVQIAAGGGGLVTIFDNFAHKYPKALYLDLSGEEIRGGDGALEAWWAMPFTPAIDHTVTRIEVAVSLHGGTDGLVLSLRSDANGLPGKTLKSWNLRRLPAEGKCCAVKVSNDAEGISIEAGKQYWVVLGTNNKEASTWANWLANAEDQIDSSAAATYDSTYGWQASTVTPQLAFAVYGSK